MEEKYFITNEFSAYDYNKLTKSIGWGEKDAKFIENALKRSTYLKAIKHNNDIIAMGRAIGDGMAFIIADVVVDENFRGLGLGKNIMNELIKEINNELKEGQECSVSLISAEGKEGFYKKCGFIQTPFDYNGYGMKLKIKK